jgi:cytochrome P450
VTHRNRNIFGEDVDTLRPERWLVNDETGKEMDRTMFHLGDGTHICIGKHIALMEMHKLVPPMLRNFEVTTDLQAPSLIPC